ncbi:hypothetical protein P153DRAFT_393786 [Dothidotthia symphoricarpi CBS 119687]|uniref:Uncharacterized protein n=1 Tax=Dothidotthia symphoricarpi CBS 119687 TaxID=1392245 RepID=A0A6A6AMP9_9PLEO|nr:uncharacterized protein P153DRAFT_393786 [Dothidotthia symphoricarpi CBS 119687]KAF2132836.1 hypothetical protein P153DRAFT_393786 [Dothidotthia symphoricarpi CBS 119687]
MVFNVLEPALTRYISLREDLEGFLRDKYGQDHPNFDFEVEHDCDRWTFEAPEKVNDKDILRLIDELQAKGQPGQVAGY